jgi:hypothetical protein
MFSSHGFKLRLITVALLLAVGILGNLQAVPLAPTGFGADTGAELFTTDNNVLSIELADNTNFFGGSFGFFYANDPGNLVQIFGPGDVDPFPGEVALIDFVNGGVFDADDPFNLIPVTAFTPQAQPIGFYLTPFLNEPALTFYTVAALNPFGADLAGVYESLNLDSFVIGFGDAEVVLSYHVLTGVNPVVPEPGTLGLISVGLGISSILRRRRNQR